MIPAELLVPPDKHAAVGRESAAPDINGLNADWLCHAQRQVRHNFFRGGISVEDFLSYF